MKHAETRKHKRFRQKNCLRQVQEKQIIIKEEGSKEGDRREEADVKSLFSFVVVKNGYADLKRRHQNDENEEDF